MTSRRGSRTMRRRPTPARTLLPCDSSPPCRPPFAVPASSIAAPASLTVYPDDDHARRPSRRAARRRPRRLRRWPAGRPVARRGLQRRCGQDRDRRQGRRRPPSRRRHGDPHRPRRRTVGHGRGRRQRLRDREAGGLHPRGRAGPHARGVQHRGVPRLVAGQGRLPPQPVRLRLGVRPRPDRPERRGPARRPVRPRTEHPPAEARPRHGPPRRRALRRRLPAVRHPRAVARRRRARPDEEGPHARKPRSLARPPTHDAEGAAANPRARHLERRPRRGRHVGGAVRRAQPRRRRRHARRPRHRQRRRRESRHGALRRGGPRRRS